MLCLNEGFLSSFHHGNISVSSLHWIAFIDLSEEKPARGSKCGHSPSQVWFILLCLWYFCWRANISGWEPFSSPTSCLLLAPGLLLLTSEAAARSSSPLLPGFYCATASWKATQLIECQMWCRPVSWALKLWGRAWIRGKVLRSDHRKSVPAGTWMRNKFAQEKLIYLSFF